MGKFIALEGIDGCGKTYQAQKITEYLEGKGYEVYSTAEPTTGRIGKLIKEIQKDPSHVPSETTMLYLYAADRAEHNEQIRKALEEGKWVVCDRYSLSSLAYQDEERSHPSPYTINSCFLNPDITILLDLPVESAIKRLQKRLDIENTHNSTTLGLEIYETEKSLSKAREAYDRSRMWNAYFNEIWKIDASKSKEEVTEKIIQIVEKMS